MWSLSFKLNDGTLLILVLRSFWASQTHQPCKKWQSFSVGSGSQTDPLCLQHPDPAGQKILVCPRNSKVFLENATLMGIGGVERGENIIGAACRTVGRSVVYELQVPPGRMWRCPWTRCQNPTVAHFFTTAVQKTISSRWSVKYVVRSLLHLLTFPLPLSP